MVKIKPLEQTLCLTNTEKQESHKWPHWLRTPYFAKSSLLKIHVAVFALEENIKDFFL